jgi:hypothetical protein
MIASYEQFRVFGFRGYESCSRCFATGRLEHTYFLRYFGPLGRMSHSSLLILFLILIQSGKRGKCNYTIDGKIVMPEHTHIQTNIHTYIHTYVHFYVDRLADYPALPGYLFIPIFYQTGKEIMCSAKST